MPTPLITNIELCKLGFYHKLFDHGCGAWRFCLHQCVENPFVFVRIPCELPLGDEVSSLRAWDEDGVVQCHLLVWAFWDDAPVCKAPLLLWGEQLHDFLVVDMILLESKHVQVLVRLIA